MTADDLMGFAATKYGALTTTHKWLAQSPEEARIDLGPALTNMVKAKKMQ